ncbi:cell adhesion molecule Dscam1-like isoform X4 [Tachypleus tridentatus]|uniref:cell adhesion molecule Dscam1-like isoform X4 n=1 Tax=Tachypleus tridentatus TaxID=6853 RepID=UPI003FD67AD3
MVIWKSWKIPLYLLLQQMIVCLVYLNSATSAQVSLKIRHFKFPEIVEEGENVQIVCGLEVGEGDIEFRWLKDGLPIVFGSSWTIVTHSKFSVLEIDNVKVGSSGNYTCIVKSNVGIDRHTAMLSVQGPPTWKEEPGDTKVVVGESVEIHCSAYGSPAPSVVWNKTGSKHGALLDFVDSHGTLRLDDVQRKDGGYYTCIIKNGIGNSLQKTVEIKINVPVKIQPFSFPREPEEGKTIQVTCGVEEGEDPVKFTWLKNGNIVHSADHLTILTHKRLSVLIVNNVNVNDIGNYSCIATNPGGEDRFSSEFFVRGPPRWNQEPQDVIVGVGDRAIFNCTALGHPKPVVRWKKEAIRGVGEVGLTDLSQSDRVRVAKNGALIIDAAKPEDAGYYNCHASTGIGPDLDKSVLLTVRVPARFEEKFTVERVHRGDSAKLECDALGDNPMTITWNKDNVRLSRVDTGRYQIFDRTTEVGTLSEIQVHGVDRSDNGLFTCVAKNTYGEDQRTIKLIVLEPPSAPSDVRIAQAWTRSVSVTWTVPYSGNSPVNKYIIQYWRNQGAPHRLEEETISSAQTSTILHKLQPGTSYVVRVMAENDVGKGTPSENRRFVTKEEEPSAPPTDVWVEPRGAGTLHIKWKAPPKDHWNGQLKGYYVGYKEKASTKSYSYKHVPFSKGLSEEYLLQHLRKNTEYGVVVMAFNDAGRGPESQEIVKTTKDSDPPPAPTLRVTALSETSISIQWRQKKSDADIISHYILFYKEDTKSWTEVTIPQTEKKEYTLLGLRPGCFYQLYLQAASQKGNSNPSETLTIRTDGTGPMERNLHAVITGEKELPEYLRLPVLAPVVASVAIIILVVIVSCVYVKKEQRRYNRAMAVTEKIYPYSMNGTPPQRYVDVEKTRPLLQPPPPPPPFPLPPPPQDNYPAPYATLPLGDNNFSADRRRLHQGRGPKSAEGSVDSRRQGGGNMIHEQVEVHHYDEAA